MSSSRRREMMLEEVGCEEERARRIFPPALMKSRSIFGVRFGPSAVHCQYRSSWRVDAAHLSTW